MRRSAGYVQDGVHVLAIDRAQQPAGLDGRCGDQLDSPGPGLVPHIGHDRQLSACSGSHHQAGARPGDVLAGRQRRVTVPVAMNLRRPLLSGPNPTRLDHHVVLEPFTLHDDGTKTRIDNVHDPNDTPTTGSGDGAVRRAPVEGA